MSAKKSQSSSITQYADMHLSSVLDKTRPFHKSALEKEEVFKLRGDDMFQDSFETYDLNSNVGFSCTGSTLEEFYHFYNEILSETDNKVDIVSLARNERIQQLLLNDHFLRSEIGVLDAERPRLINTNFSGEVSAAATYDSVQEVSSVVDNHSTVDTEVSPVVENNSPVETEANPVIENNSTVEIEANPVVENNSSAEVISEENIPNTLNVQTPVIINLKESQKKQLNNSIKETIPSLNDKQKIDITPNNPMPNNNPMPKKGSKCDWIYNIFKDFFTQNTNIYLIPIIVGGWSLVYFMYEYQIFDYLTWNNFFKNNKNIILDKNNLINEHSDTISNTIKIETLKEKDKKSYIIFGIVLSTIIITTAYILKQ